MTCLRCQGLLRVEVIPRGRHKALHLWACTSCGDRIDATILCHRRSMVREETAHQWKDRVWQRIRTLNAMEVPA